MEEDIKRDIVNYRRQKACDLMHDVDVLIDNELWNSAVNRMYYACFHMVSALLILHGIEVKSHMGVRQAFGLHFVKTNLLSSECGRIFSKIYDKRQSSVNALLLQEKYQKGWDMVLVRYLSQCHCFYLLLIQEGKNGIYLA